MVFKSGIVVLAHDIWSKTITPMNCRCSSSEIGKEFEKIGKSRSTNWRFRGFRCLREREISNSRKGEKNLILEELFPSFRIFIGLWIVRCLRGMGFVYMQF